MEPLILIKNLSLNYFVHSSSSEKVAIMDVMALREKIGFWARLVDMRKLFAYEVVRFNLFQTKSQSDENHQERKEICIFYDLPSTGRNNRGSNK